MNFKPEITAYIKITRPVNVLITFITIIVASVICTDGSYPVAKIIFAAVSASFTAGAGNIINDIFDIEIDRINRPDRPLPSGKLKPDAAYFFYSLLVVCSVILSALINSSALIIELFTTAALFSYSYKLKKIPLAGNITISFLTGLVFIYGGVAVNNTSYALLPAFFAFAINLIRELIKDMEDIKGDYPKGANTFPVKYGFTKTKKIIIVSTLILIAATVYPFIFRFYKIEYFIIVMVVVNPILIYIISSLLKDDSSKNLNKLSFFLKLNMVFGLIAIYFGK